MEAIALANKFDTYTDKAVQRLRGHASSGNEFLIDILGGSSVKSTIEMLRPTPHEEQFLSIYDKDKVKYDKLVKVRDQLAYVYSTMQSFKNMFGAGQDSTEITDVDHMRQMTLGYINMKASLREIKLEVK